MLRVVLLSLTLLAPAPAVVAVDRAAVSTPIRCAGRYNAPVDAPVVDPFRLPDGPYRAGNRGLEYGTAAGDTIRAIGPGTVLFAGRIAGTWHVTVGHDDGLRSSYAFLASVALEEGDAVAVGDVVGRAGEQRFHLGVRDATGYVDPAPLLGGRARAWLIPRSRFGDGGGCSRAAGIVERTLSVAALANR